MSSLSIGISTYSDKLLENLLKVIGENDIGSRIKIHTVRESDWNRITCRVKLPLSTGRNKKQALKNIKAGLSSILAGVIMSHFEEKLLSRIINSSYCYFSPRERNEILGIALRLIKAADDQGPQSSSPLASRKEIIERNIEKYLETSKEVLLEGFVNFRIKEYLRELEEIADMAVDEFLVQREYLEFIRLLRYFVDIQEPKLELIHIIIGFNNKYIILNNDGKEVTNQCIREFAVEKTIEEINQEDLLISSLITLAPLRIYLHITGQVKNKEIIETIKSVFWGKVIICTGCALCKANMANIKP